MENSLWYILFLKSIAEGPVGIGISIFSRFTENPGNIGGMKIRIMDRTDRYIGAIKFSDMQRQIGDLRIISHNIPGFFQFINHICRLIEGVVDIMSPQSWLIGSITMPGDKIQGYIFINTEFKESSQPLFCFYTTDDRPAHLKTVINFLNSSG